MRTTLAGAAAAALLLSGCSLTIDPDSVKPPVCVSTGCSTVVCGNNDNCGNLCAMGSGCIAGCVSTGCSTVVCGQPDNCGTTCNAGSGCITAGHRIEGGVTFGGASGVGPAHRVTGTIGGGAGAQQPANATHKIEQGTLR